MHKGSCLCGAITFEVAGELAAPTACHCQKCSKHTGHYEAGGDYYDIADGAPQDQQ